MGVIAYENVPVFRAHGEYDIEHLIGKANVKVNDGKIETIEIHTVGESLNAFLDLGALKALSLSEMVTNVDAEKVKEYWSL